MNLLNFTNHLPKSLMVIPFLAILFTPAIAQDNTFEMNIVTGQESGTYIQIGRDLAELGKSCDRPLIVNESAGSLENIAAIGNKRYTQFGIVQSDVLQYFANNSKTDPALLLAMSDVVIAAPLYNEEIQILAKRDIKSLADLNGKRVSVGVLDSGTFLTASLILGLTETTPAEIVNLDARHSLGSMLVGDLDAFFYVAGVPTELLMNKYLTSDDFHLLPLVDDALNEIYIATEIPAGTYAFQNKKVDTYSVKAVLMTREFDPDINDYNKLSCDAVSDFSYLIHEQFESLKENGHPKWENVDLDDVPPGWKVGACVKRGAEPSYRSNCTANK